jgi:hypothetical protein
MPAILAMLTQRWIEGMLGPHQQDWAYAFSAMPIDDERIHTGVLEEIAGIVDGGARMVAQSHWAVFAAFLMKSLQSISIWCLTFDLFVFSLLTGEASAFENAFSQIVADAH